MAGYGHINDGKDKIMKYIVVENKGQKEEELHYDIADFLWNSGNEVYIRDNNATDFQKIVKDCDCIISLVYKRSSSELLSERGTKGFSKYFELENYQNKKTILVFSNTGVYTNAIPFPHKIFHFEKLDKNEITSFFNWSRSQPIYFR
jgi:hypothetical protein